MSKSFFNEDERYNDDGSEMTSEVKKVLTPIIDKYVKMGYSHHEISHLLMTTAHVEVITHRYSNK